MEWFRLTLEDNNAVAQIEIDVLVDASQQIATPFTYHGVWRNLDESGTYPLLVLYNGTVDYGHNAGSGVQRYDEMTLHGESVAGTSTFLYRDIDEHESYWFGIKKISRLASNI